MNKNLSRTQRSRNTLAFLFPTFESSTVKPICPLFFFCKGGAGGRVQGKAGEHGRAEEGYGMYMLQF